MNITTVGLKAEISVGRARADVAAGASLDPYAGEDVLISGLSMETALNGEIEYQEWDGVTFSNLEAQTGAALEAQANDDPASIENALPIENSIMRVRNSNAAARWMAIYYWRLV